MGRRRKRRSDAGATSTADAKAGECKPGWCLHGGKCARSAAGGAGCVCTGPWGGPQCRDYVGHDHACLTLVCAPPTLCVWPSPAEGGVSNAAYCACPEGGECATATGLGAHDGAAPAVVAVTAAGAGGAWAGSVLGLLAVVALVVGAFYWRRRQRHGAFVHARLADNVEISNPMYLAGEGEDDEAPPPHTHVNGGSHFANPVYDSLYAAAAGPRAPPAPPEVLRPPA